MSRAVFIKVFFVSFVTWGLANWKSNQVPSQIPELSFLKNDPVQTPTAEKPFEKTVNKQKYQIEPVFDYDMWGLVVADHDSESWNDSAHAAWNDFINTKDICVIWGDHVYNSHLSKLNFSHGEWTCYVQTRDGEAWRKFDMTRLANNHLIPASIEIKKLIASSHVGDVIHIKGQLVNYSVNGGPQRKTSTVRNDRENGACEIIYVNEFTTLNRYNHFWINMARMAKWICLVSVIALIVAQIVFHMSFKQE